MIGISINIAQFVKVAELLCF